MRMLPFLKLKVSGKSMEPTFKEGDELISLNWFYQLKVGDLVVLKYKDREIIKRIKKIKGNEIYVMGDNPKVSTDSRQFGWIEKDRVIGKIIFKL